MVDDNTKEILKDIRDNTSNIQVTAEPPVGGATEAKQDAIITAIEAIPGGGGTQYTEGDTDASVTGTVAMWEDTSDTLRAVSAAKPLPVNIVAGAGSGGTASADDADFTAGTTSGTPAMGVYESTPSSVTDGDLGTLGITAGRRLKTSATIDAALPAGTNAIGKLAANSGVDIGDVDVTSSALPTGASTLAEQQSQTTHLATIAGDTTSIQTAVEALDNSVDGNYLNVNMNIAGTDVIAGAGVITAQTQRVTIATDDEVNNLLGTIDADTSILAGAVTGTEMQVDVLTMPTTTVQATNLDIRDLTSVSDSVAAAQSGTWNVTNVSGTVSLPTGASTLGEQQTQTTHLATIAGDTTDIETAVELIDDTVATLGTTTYTEAATKGLIMGAIRRDADTTLVDTTNEATPLQVDAAGRLKVEAFSGETLPVSLTSTTVTGTVAVTQSGTWDEVGINDSGNSITVDYATTGSGTATGALRVELPTNGTGVIATVGAVTAITNALPAGTNAIGKLSANNGVDIGDVDVTSITGVTMNNGAIQVTGDEAHDAVDAGNPMKIGGRAQEPTADPDEVADNDRVDTLHDRVGRVAVYQGYPRWYAVINAATSGNNTIKAAAGVGKKIVVTSVSIISDGTVDIRWESGADGTALSGQMPLLVNTGYSASDPNGLFETAANALLNLELSAAVNVHGHIAGMIIDD